MLSVYLRITKYQIKIFLCLLGRVLFILLNVQNNPLLRDSAGNVNGSSHCFNFPEFQNFFPALCAYNTKVEKEFVCIC